MNSIILIVLLLTLSLNEKTYPTFAEFIKKYDKNYNEQQYIKRQLLYKAKIQQLKNSSCQSCGITKYADLTIQQFHRSMGLKYQSHITILKVSKGQNQNLQKQSAASQLDWRKKSAITSVKNQGQCGTCWSFTTVALSQSSLLLKGKAGLQIFGEIDLSEQYLLKCTKNSDCNGGFLEYAIDKALDGGIPFQRNYPYQPYRDEPGICQTRNKEQISDFPRRSFYQIDDEAIKQLMSTGPLAIAISADSWNDYSGGVHQCPLQATTNHAVLLVGYTEDYWIIKNQWGKNWGQDGYIRVTRSRSRNCNIGIAVHLLWQGHYSAILLVNMFLLLIFAS